MDDIFLLYTFDRETTCEYRKEKYHVRDNGSIFRLRRIGKRKRPLDEKWTFGTPDISRGYLRFSSEAAHRIVATAFLGSAPSKSHVVDHIDTNKKNNRPENLRWVTRLENILLNPITAKRIILAYGSIENFLSDPKNPKHEELDNNFDFMRTVTKEEAEYSYQRLLEWAKKSEIPKGEPLGEWIYGSLQQEMIEEPKDVITVSETKNAIQKNWKTPSEFPHCPLIITSDVLIKYQKRLKEGEVFSRNYFGESQVVSAQVNSNSNELIIMTINENVKDWALAKVYIDNNLFVHESLGTFFSLDGARKQFYLNMGWKWEGEDSIDDYL